MRLSLLALGAVLMCNTFAQETPSVLRFEVASVKPHEGPMPRIGVYTSGNRLDAVFTARGLIMYAYNLKNYQVSGAALESVTDTHYDVVAKAEGDQVPTVREFREMMRSLLAVRFRLTAHMERREMPVFELVVAKGGPRFQLAAPDASSGGNVGVKGRNYEITVPKATIADFIAILDNVGWTDRPIVDATQLTGTYEIKLTYTPNLYRDADLGDTPVSVALQEQLGLKLVPQRAPMDVIVVDHIEKPSVN